MLCSIPESLGRARSIFACCSSGSSMRLRAATFDIVPLFFSFFPPEPSLSRILQLDNPSTRAVWHVLLSAQACRMLIGARGPMLCPNWGFRAVGGRFVSMNGTISISSPPFCPRCPLARFHEHGCHRAVPFDPRNAAPADWRTFGGVVSKMGRLTGNHETMNAYGGLRKKEKKKTSLLDHFLRISSLHPSARRVLCSTWC